MLRVGGPAGELLLCDTFFHGTFPDSPDGTVISCTDHYSFRHDVSGGGEVDIDVKGTFTATGNRA